MKIINIILKTVVRILIALIVLLAISCNSGKKETKKEGKAEVGDVKLFTLVSGNLGQEIHIPGVLEPYEFVQIFPKVNGFIKSINVDRGSAVRSGQILMTLDAPEIEEHMSAARLKYVEAVANIQISKDKYKRLKETSKTPGTVSEYDLQSAFSKMMADSAIVQGELSNYNAQKTMFTYLTVMAPFDGIITERNVHPGALVGPGSQTNIKPMLVLQQQNRLRLTANIPEQYSSQIKDGQMVHFTINSIPGKIFDGKISRSSGSLSEKFRSETIEIDVTNDTKEIKAGMYAEITIPASGSSNAFKVPKTAVITTTERKYVLVVRDNLTKKIDITEGNHDESNIEIFGDLKSGEKIFAIGNEEIPEGKMMK